MKRVKRRRRKDGEDRESDGGEVAGDAEQPCGVFVERHGGDAMGWRKQRVVRSV